MSNKTRAEELADQLLNHADDHKEVAHSFDMRPEDSLNWQHMLTAKEAAAELRRLAGVEACQSSLIDQLTERRAAYQDLLADHVALRAERDRLAAEVEALRADAERQSHINCELRQELDSRREAIRLLLLDNNSPENRKFARWACGEGA